MNFQAYTLTNHPEWACITVKADESEARTPVHLCCIIDVSGSMELDSKLTNVKRSLQYLLDFLGPQDSISIITFSNVARTVIKNVAAFVTEKENIRTRISLIRADSNTNLSAGIIEARESLVSSTSEVKQGILLLTDGIANMGITNTDAILDIVRSTVDKFSGTSISCVGYGTDHKVDLLQQISGAGGGSYYVVNSLEDVANVFGDVLGGLVSCVAQQVRVELPLGTEVKTRYSVSSDASTMTVLIGDLPAGSEAVLLARLTNQGVVLKGYDLQHHATFVHASAIQTNEDLELQTNGDAHFLRFEVLDIVEQAQRMIEVNTSQIVVNAHIRRIRECIAEITAHRAEHEHTLWGFLLEELEACIQNLENRHRATAETTHVMSQHTTVLGRMRGIAATPLSQQATLSIPSAVPVTRAFSNVAQRNISSQLYTTITPVRSGDHPANDDLSQDLSQEDLDGFEDEIMSNYPATPSAAQRQTR